MTCGTWGQTAGRDAAAADRPGTGRVEPPPGRAGGALAVRILYNRGWRAGEFGSPGRAGATGIPRSGGFPRRAEHAGVAKVARLRPEWRWRRRLRRQTLHYLRYATGPHKLTP